MAETQRSSKAWMFAAGLLLGAGLAVWGYHAWSQRQAADAEPVAAATAAAALETVAPPAPVAAAAPTAVAAAPAGSCPAEPLLPPGNAPDGQFALQAALATSLGTDPGVYLKIADEVVAQGRPRDAEVAWIVACRLAEQAGGFSSAALGDVKSRLAQHYATVVAAPAAPELREQLLARSESLLGDSVKAYTAALGSNASKTRMASQRLARLEEPAAQPPLETVRVSPAVRESPPTTMGAARSSLASRPPRVDEDVSDMDRDLQRLYAQARAVSRDPAGMQRRQQQALAARSACRDDACLRNWYAQRKRQLFDEF